MTDIIFRLRHPSLSHTPHLDRLEAADEIAALRLELERYKCGLDLIEALCKAEQEKG